MDVKKGYGTKRKHSVGKGDERESKMNGDDQWARAHCNSWGTCQPSLFVRVHVRARVRADVWVCMCKSRKVMRWQDLKTEKTWKEYRKGLWRWTKGKPGKKGTSTQPNLIDSLGVPAAPTSLPCFCTVHGLRKRPCRRSPKGRRTVRGGSCAQG